MIIKLAKRTKVYVLGDLHEHPMALKRAIKHIKPNPEKILVSVGDLFDKGWGKESAEEMVEIFKDLTNRRAGYIIRGNHELKHIRRALRDNEKLSSGLQWMAKQPLALCFEYTNGSRLLVVHGGVTPHHRWDQIGKDIETCYVRSLDKRGKSIPLVTKKDENGNKVMVPREEGKPWHELYDGRFGYIASGHNAQKDGIPKFYNFSCNLDTAVYHTGKLSVQCFSELGREELLTFECEPKYKDLDEMFALMSKRHI